MRVLFSMRTRSASRSCFAGRPLFTPRASESSIHSVRTTNGTPSSRSVSAAFTMPSPSDSAAVSFPGALTLTMTTKRRSRFFVSRFFFPAASNDSLVRSFSRYDTSEVTFSRSYVPNEYGLSGQSFSKNRRSDSASTWFFRLLDSRALSSRTRPVSVSFLSSAKMSRFSEERLARSSSNTAGFRGSRICTESPPLC